MTNISASGKLLTLINVFKVRPENQMELLDILGRATDEDVRHEEGFISAALHRSIDGTKVTMYAQWRSLEDYEAMRLKPGPLPALQKALTIAEFESAMYEVFRTFDPGEGFTSGE